MSQIRAFIMNTPRLHLKPAEVNTLGAWHARHPQHHVHSNHPTRAAVEVTLNNHEGREELWHLTDYNVSSASCFIVRLIAKPILGEERR